MVHAFFNPTQAAAFDALAPKTDSTFEIRYFHLHGQGGMSRTLIVIGTGGHSRLTNVHEGDWAEYKPTTPFGVMPLLTETSADGKTKLQIAESDSIERYLARKFGLFGSGSAFEEVLVNTFANNTQALIVEIINKFALVEDAEVKAANKRPLITDHIARWIKHHEEHLQAKGANGHYVGNKVTLADVKTDYVISMIQGVSGEELVSEEKTPAIWKVRQEMDKIEGVAAWKASEEYKSLDKENFEFLAY
ncbi:Glutathione S-transferase S1 [Linnemannia exigua]|uniref:glutathione transferase n=1 Tax=Linnemannia exigua TaxID=604196 RepID=A0AAD4D4M2_9FUNG|nr:Glutathione S-transferase S1 [Linnemannia exigua]